MGGLERMRSGLGAGASSIGRRLAAPLALPRRPFWLRVRLDAAVPEIPRAAWPGRPAAPGLYGMLEALAHAAGDPRVVGVVVRIRGAPVSLAQALGLRRAFAALRAAGKPVVVYAERLGSEELFLAAGASRIFVPEAGSVAPLGLRTEVYFVRDLLERLGVRAEVVRVGDFKSAGEELVRRGMSDAQRRQLEALLDDLFGVLVEGIAEGRGLTPQRVRELVDTAPHRPRGAREAGLIDDCLFPDELEGALSALVGEAGATPLVADLATYATIRARDPGLRSPFARAARIAYVVAAGVVRSGAGAGGVASDAYRALFRRLEKDDAVGAAVLRIESPGGDALASDLLWRSVRQLAAKKPVVASLGRVAASGGYYLASAADSIFAESATLTGSIGVVGGKLDLGGLQERLGIAPEAIERGARAGMLASSRAMSPADRSAYRAELDAVYDLFLDRVAEGRRMTREAVHAVARGRVWSGRRALEEGLVDALGGPLEALGEARRRIGVAPGERVTVDLLPRAVLFGGFAARLLRRGAL
jgi:protease IV